MIQFDEHIFEMGWNRQLDQVFFEDDVLFPKQNMLVPWCVPSQKDSQWNMVDCWSTPPTRWLVTRSP